MRPRTARHLHGSARVDPLRVGDRLVVLPFPAPHAAGPESPLESEHQLRRVMPATLTAGPLVAYAESLWDELARSEAYGDPKASALRKVCADLDEAMQLAAKAPPEISVDEAAARWRVTPQTARAKFRAFGAILGARKPGRSWIADREQVERFDARSRSRP